jgi:predicted HD phosphohydrolase
MTDTDLLEKTASFHTMDQGTQEDWDIIMSHLKPFAAQGGKRVLDHLKLLEGDCGGFAVDRLTHCLQTATRAHRDGRSEDYVVMALLHDIGDTLGAFNHPDVAAAIIKPFVSDELHWITQHHGIFQGYNFFHYIGLGRNLRATTITTRPPPNSSRNTIARPSTRPTTPRRSHSSSRW